METATKSEHWTPENRGRAFYAPRRAYHEGNKYGCCHVCGAPLPQIGVMYKKGNGTARKICQKKECHQKVFDQGLKNARAAGWEKMAPFVVNGFKK